MRRIRIVALLVAPLLIASTVAAGPNYAPGSLDRWIQHMRIAGLPEWRTRRLGNQPLE